MSPLIKAVLLPFLFIANHGVCAQSTSLPSWFIHVFKKNKLDERYTLKSYLHPAQLQADFNGDGVKDLAAIVTEKKTNKGGILLIHGGTNQWFVFGAGTDFGNGSNDFFNWMKRWRIYRNKVVYETTFNKDGDITGSKTVKLQRPGIAVLMMEDKLDESPVAVIYWDGKKYIWIHQGE